MKTNFTLIYIQMVDLQKNFKLCIMPVVEYLFIKHVRMKSVINMDLYLAEQ